jgi:hypothetical protein
MSEEDKFRIGDQFTCSKRKDAVKFEVVSVSDDGYTLGYVPLKAIRNDGEYPNIRNHGKHKVKYIDKCVAIKDAAGTCSVYNPDILSLFPLGGQRR